MNTLAYATRKAKVVEEIMTWADMMGVPDELRPRILGQLGNVPPDIRELFRLEALAEFLSSRTWMTSTGEITGQGGLDLTSLDVDEVREAVKKMGRPEVLVLIGQELRAEQPRKNVVNALESAYMKAEASAPEVVESKEKMGSDGEEASAPSPKGKRKEK